ncbi:MAG: hypothetical protein V1859_02040 [archaeon]
MKTMRSLKNYKNNIKNRIFIQNLLIFICIAAIAALLFFQLRPKVVVVSNRDECGPIGNTISHTINSEDTCINSCRSACKSYKYEYFKSKFIYNKEMVCNNCTCYCTE